MFLGHCEGNQPVIGGVPLQSPVAESFDVFFDVRLDEQKDELLVIRDAITLIVTSLQRYVAKLSRQSYKIKKCIKVTWYER